MSFSKEILVHHGRECPYCHGMMRVPFRKKRAQNTDNFPTRDHVIPKSVMPGMGTLIVCRKCNTDKRNYTLPEWYELLKNQCDARATIIKDFMKKQWFKKLNLTENKC